MTRSTLPAHGEYLPSAPPITEGHRKLSSRASRAELRVARRHAADLARRADRLDEEVGLVRDAEPASPPPDDPIAATGYWQAYLAIIGAVGRQKALVDRLEAELAGSPCSHSCAIHRNPISERLDAARAELAHVSNAAARLGAAPQH